jgi:hypothetical protein
MYATYELNSDFQKTPTLSFPVSPNAYSADTRISGVYDVLASGSTQHSKMNVRYFGSGTTILQQSTFTLSGAPATYRVNRTFDPLSRSVVRVDIAFSGSSLTGNSINKIYWNGNLDIYKDRWRYITGETTFWKGYVQPDRLSRSFLDGSYLISLGATDSLNDLKQINFPSEAIGIGSGFARQIFVLQDAIYQTGLDDLPIRSQVNLKANGITTYSSTFNNVASNNYRFIKDQKDGKTTYTSCNEAINWVLEPYTARLAQSKGGWTITNLNEITSILSTYSPGAFSPTTTAFTRTIASGSTLTTDSDELSKIRPDKAMTITQFNKALPSQLQVNSDFSNGTSGYVNASYPNNFYSFGITGSELRCVVQSPPLASNPNIDHWFTGPQFTLLTASASTATVNVMANLNAVTYSASTSSFEYPYLHIKVTRNGGATFVASSFAQGDRMQPGYHLYSLTFPVTTTDTDYQITITVKPDLTTDYQSINTRFRYVHVTQTFPDKASFDKYYIATNTNTSAINVADKTLYFGDGLGQTDIGTLKTDSITLTNSWSNYGQTNNLPLINIYAKNRLKMNSRFKNYLNLTFLRNDINIDSVLPIKGKLYYPVALSHSLGESKISVSLVELLTDDINVSVTPTTLSSIDGDL